MIPPRRFSILPAVEDEGNPTRNPSATWDIRGDFDEFGVNPIRSRSNKSRLDTRSDPFQTSFRATVRKEGRTSSWSLPNILGSRSDTGEFSHSTAITKPEGRPPSSVLDVVPYLRLLSSLDATTDQGSRAFSTVIAVLSYHLTSVPETIPREYGTYAPPSYAA